MKENNTSLGNLKEFIGLFKDIKNVFFMAPNGVKYKTLDLHNVPTSSGRMDVVARFIKAIFFKKSGIDNGSALILSFNWEFFNEFVEDLLLNDLFLKILANINKENEGSYKKHNYPESQLNASQDQNKLKDFIDELNSKKILNKFTFIITPNSPFLKNLAQINMKIGNNPKKRTIFENPLILSEDFILRNLYFSIFSSVLLILITYFYIYKIAGNPQKGDNFLENTSIKQWINENISFTLFNSIYKRFFDSLSDNWRVAHEKDYKKLMKNTLMYEILSVEYSAIDLIKGFEKSATNIFLLKEDAELNILTMSEDELKGLLARPNKVKVPNLFIIGDQVGFSEIFLKEFYEQITNFRIISLGKNPLLGSEVVLILSWISGLYSCHSPESTPKIKDDGNRIDKP
ncbi:MAG: hypothetical protein ACTSU2_08040 [Promethearchaeota archaeon]